MTTPRHHSPSMGLQNWGAQTDDRDCCVFVCWGDRGWEPTASWEHGFEFRNCPPPNLGGG